MNAALLRANDAHAARLELERPSVLQIAAGLMTGRFESTLQPAAAADTGAVPAAIPGPLIIAVPMMVAAFAATRGRRIALGPALGVMFVIAFAYTTWLPDQATSVAASRVSSLLLIALGLSWVADTGPRGCKLLAATATVVLAVTPWVPLNATPARVATAEMESFALAASGVTGDGFWSADRISTSRALLQHADAAFHGRWMDGTADKIARTPDDAQVVAFSGQSAQAIGAGLWSLPAQVPHFDAATFLGSLPESRWLALASRGSRGSGFCRDLLSRLGVTDASESTPIAAVTNPHRAGSTSIAHGALDLPYGDRVPAHVSIELDPAATITINGRKTAAIANGLVIATFDVNDIRVRSWTVGDCDRPKHPPIEDRRLSATYVVEGTELDRFRSLRVVSNERVDVPLGEGSDEWFGPGWHAAEGDGPHAVRWTAALDAQVVILVSHRQSLRVRLQASLASREPGKNTLQIAWNGSAIGLPIGSPVESVWEVPARVVRRGVNTLTIRVAELVSPADITVSTDHRLLGAAVSRLSIEPDHRPVNP
jgi:hypothetical protein